MATKPISIYEATSSAPQSCAFLAHGSPGFGLWLKTLSTDHSGYFVSKGNTGASLRAQRYSCLPEDTFLCLDLGLLGHDADLDKAVDYLLDAMQREGSLYGKAWVEWLLEATSWMKGLDEAVSPAILANVWAKLHEIRGRHNENPKRAGKRRVLALKMHEDQTSERHKTSGAYEGWLI